MIEEKIDNRIVEELKVDGAIKRKVLEYVVVVFNDEEKKRKSKIKEYKHATKYEVGLPLGNGIYGVYCIVVNHNNLIMLDFENFSATTQNEK